MKNPFCYDLGLLSFFYKRSYTSSFPAVFKFDMLFFIQNISSPRLKKNFSLRKIAYFLRTGISDSSNFHKSPVPAESHVTTPPERGGKEAHRQDAGTEKQHQVPEEEGKVICFPGTLLPGKKKRFSQALAPKREQCTCSLSGVFAFSGMLRFSGRSDQNISHIPKKIFFSQ